jgi:hypothetical protein
VPEVRRLVLAMVAGSAKERNFRLRWSLWRRAHQAVAARRKKASRAAREVLRRGEPPEERTTGPKVSVLCAEGGPLTDEEWEIVEPLIPCKPPVGRSYHDQRRVLGGILWEARMGSSWREMPEEEFGKWETAYRRYDELWLEQGLWERILQALGEEVVPGPTTKES